jgi:hypothetical protein
MEKIRDIFKNPWVVGVAGFVLGLIIGLPVLGWAVWPVQWKDADVSYLREDLKAQYFCMVVDSFKVNQNAGLAQARLDSMGITALNYSSSVSQFQADGCSYSPADETVLAIGSSLSALPAGDTANTQTTSMVPTAATTTNSTKKNDNGISGILAGLFCVIFLAIGGYLIYHFFFKNRKPREQVPTTTETHEFPNPLEDEDFARPAASRSAPVAAAPAAAATDMPAAHFMTTYKIGDDLYDDSFSIDTARGEFLGECGVGISDMVGVGEPKKVSAFEVWLFDKNDTQTVTKVLMSSRAMSDPAVRQRLASRGEPVQVEPGQEIILETPSLQLQAKVVELVYGQGALPAGSYFERLTLELSVWAK